MIPEKRQVEYVLIEQPWMKIYHTPQLVQFGTISDMTLGGVDPVEPDSLGGFPSGEFN